MTADAVTTSAVTIARDGPCELSWFSALCDDDYEQLGVVDGSLRSSLEHCGDIVRTAQRLGFDNVLLPSGYALGIDTVAFAAAMAPTIDVMRMLVAVRSGEMWVPQLARQLAILDQMLQGWLTVNIISSDLPGQELASAPRYRRTLEIMTALRALLGGTRVDLDGEFLQLHLDPPGVRTVSGTCPPLYFGGLSDDAREVAAAAADVYLMWPNTLVGVAAVLGDMCIRAKRFGRSLRFGYRVHVVVRETEAQARAAAAHLVAAVDDEQGARIRTASLDSESVGVRHRAELREAASLDDFVEDNLWTGIGRARSGCGAALVGDSDQILAKLGQYRDLGIDAFVLSGYPHRDEAEWFGRLVLPHLPHGPLPR